jgi:hypothetical protein
MMQNNNTPAKLLDQVRNRIHVNTQVLSGILFMLDISMIHFDDGFRLFPPPYHLNVCMPGNNKVLPGHPDYLNTPAGLE